MKKAFFMLLLTGTLGYSQVKTSGLIQLKPDLSVEFKLDAGAGKVTAIINGPADRWFGVVIRPTGSTTTGMKDGDLLLFSSNTFSDRNLVATGSAGVIKDASEDWSGDFAGVVNGTVRTLTLTRNLTNSDTAGQDFQMPYGTTNSFKVLGVTPPTPAVAIGGHNSNNGVTSATATFTILGVEDFSLNAATVGPNPAKGSFTINSKTGINKVEIYSQTGAFVKTINVNPSSNTEISVDGLSQGVYLMELKNDTDSSWKKVIVD
jgi:hypothetical protein